MKASYIIFFLTGVFFLLIIFGFLENYFNREAQKRLISSIVASQVFVVLVDQTYYFLIIFLIEFLVYQTSRFNR